METRIFGIWPAMEKYKDKIHFRAAWPEIYYRESGGNTPSIEEAVQDIKTELAKGKSKIIFDCSGESLLHPIMKMVHLTVDLIPELDPKDVFFITGSLDGEETYERYVKSINRTKGKINILSRSTFEMSVLTWIQTMPERDSTNVPEENPFVYHIKLKEKKFTFMNRVMRGHRLKLISKIIEEGLIDEGFCSAGFPDDWRDTIRNLAINAPECAIELNHLLDTTSMLPLILNMTEERGNPINLLYEDMDYHRNSYFNLITETIFYNNPVTQVQKFLKVETGKTIFLTEKTFKSIAFKHPFILCSNTGILDVLRKMGYQTFHPYIDETYDIIEDDNMRLDAIVKEVHRLCSFTDQEWIEWQINIKPIVEHNYKVFMNKTHKDTGITTNIDELFDR